MAVAVRPFHPKPISFEFLHLLECLQCSFHGARFQIDDGYCIAGPCQGRSLRAFPISLVDGIVSVAERPASRETTAGTRR